MAERKPVKFKAEDIVVLTAAAAGLNLNNVENHFLVRLALTEAQQEICVVRPWRWLESVGNFVYSTKQSTVNMYSANNNTYSTFGGFTFMRLADIWPLKEIPMNYMSQLRLGVSTASRPSYYARFGEANIRFHPIPTLSDSVHFGFIKRPGQVYGNGDIIIPKEYHLTVLVRAARNKIWELRNDPRAQAQDRTMLLGLAAMIRADAGTSPDTADLRYWHASPYGVRPDLKHEFSDFYSTGNMP